MLQRLVAQWLRQQAQEAILRSATGSPQQHEDGDENSDTVDVICIYPSAEEAGGLLDRLSDIHTLKCHGFTERIGRLDDKVIGIVEAPLSHERLAPVIRDVVTIRQPSWTLVCGFAAGLDQTIKRGDIVVADRIVDGEGYSLQTGTKMPAAKGLHVGTLLTLEQPPSSPNEKLAQSKSTEAIACDRQAAVAAEVCRFLKAPLMSVHVVAEAANARGNAALKKVRSQDSMASMIGAAAGAILDQPGSLKAFWNEKEHGLRLSDRLANFLTGMIAQLPGGGGPQDAATTTPES